MELVYPHLNGAARDLRDRREPRALCRDELARSWTSRNPTRLEGERLRYPAWEVEYRLKTIGELKDYEKVFLFATQPAHKGLHAAGSETLAELINTYRPQLAVVAGNGVAETRLGRTLVVCPAGSSRANTRSSICTNSPCRRGHWASRRRADPCRCQSAALLVGLSVARAAIVRRLASVVGVIVEAARQDDRARAGGLAGAQHGPARRRAAHRRGRPTN